MPNLAMPSPLAVPSPLTATTSPNPSHPPQTPGALLPPATPQSPAATSSGRRQVLTEALSNVPPGHRKQAVGEWLFPLLQKMKQVSDPAKVMGMLLEMEAPITTTAFHQQHHLVHLVHLASFPSSGRAACRMSRVSAAAAERRRRCPRGHWFSACTHHDRSRHGAAPRSGFELRDAAPLGAAPSCRAEALPAAPAAGQCQDAAVHILDPGREHLLALHHLHLHRPHLRCLCRRVTASTAKAATSRTVCQTWSRARWSASRARSQRPPSPKACPDADPPIHPSLPRSR